MSKEILKNEALKEIFKCARDPIYFINNFCKIRHPTKGLIDFKLYSYQEDAVTNFLAHKKNIINKARQLGFSTLLAAFIVWLILFHNHKEVLVVSIRADVAKNLIRKVKLMIRHIPDWMFLAEIVTNQAHAIGLSNGSSVKSVARSEDAGRSEALALLVIDEAAHIRDMDELWKGLGSTVSTGGKVIALSTPKGASNWFYRFCKEAQSKENGWNYQEVHWWQNPEYAHGMSEDSDTPGGKTSPWFEEFTAGWSRQQIAQELLTSFTETGDTFLDPPTIMYYQEQTRDPVDKLGPDKGLWVWKYPQPTKKYIISTDTSSGTSEDYSTAIVLEPEDLEVVAEFKSKVPPDSFGDWLAKDLGPTYNNALIIPENNSIGMVTAYGIKNADYFNLAYIDEKSGRLVDKWTAEYLGIQPGFQTNGKNRPIILQKMEELLRKKLIKSYSMRLVNELLSFVWSSGKAQSKKGSNDDLIMALAIGLWIRESYFAYSKNSTEDILSMYSSVTVNSRSSDELMNTSLRAKIAQDQKKQNEIKIGDQVINLNLIYKT